MTEKEIRLWMLGESAKDRWWMQVGEERQTAKVSLADAANYAAAHPEAEVQVLHVTQAEVKLPPWVVVDPAPIMTPDQRNSLQAIKHRRAKSIIIQLVVLLLILGLAASFLFSPEPVAEELRPKVDPKDQLLEQLAGIDTVGASQLPMIYTTVARTGRIMFITNQNPVAWPSCEIILPVGDDTYVYHYTEPVEAKRTLQVPLREFKQDGVSFPPEVSPEDISLVVPGYREWEDSF